MYNIPDETILYAGPFSELAYSRGKKLIVATWKENSRNLEEQGVKDELKRLLEFIVKMQAENVIVDTRHYYFADDGLIQNWINTTYVQQLMESRVKQYAFVVDSVAAKAGQGTDSDDHLPRVEYFSSPQEAMTWIQ